jgi:F-box/leucine-rich repeat protein 2/20
VCRLWNILALDGSNWQKVNLFEFQRDIKVVTKLLNAVYPISQGPVVENLARRCGGFLKKLSLDGCKEIQDGALHAFASRCHNIDELNLHMCGYVTDA